MCALLKCASEGIASFAADTFFGTMYTSDDRGILFSKSLERHLFDGLRKSDFTNITSLRGVYLTNKLDQGQCRRRRLKDKTFSLIGGEMLPVADASLTVSVADNRIRSVISFNRGGTWRQLNKPDNVDCDAQVQKVRARAVNLMHFELFRHKSDARPPPV